MRWRISIRSKARQGMVQRHRGQGLVEMALIVMIMMVIATATIDFGIYMYRYVQAANCAREAARRAVVRADNATNPPYCVDAGLTPTLSPAGYKTLGAGEEVQASVNATHNWLALDSFIPGLGPGPIRARASMRMEGQKV